MPGSQREARRGGSGVRLGCVPVEIVLRRTSGRSRCRGWWVFGDGFGERAINYKKPYHVSRYLRTPAWQEKTLPGACFLGSSAGTSSSGPDCRFPARVAARNASEAGAAPGRRPIHSPAAASLVAGTVSTVAARNGAWNRAGSTPFHPPGRFKHPVRWSVVPGVSPFPGTVR